MKNGEFPSSCPLSLTLTSDLQVSAEWGALSLDKGSHLRGQVACAPWSTDSYNLEWKIRYQFCCSSGEFVYTGFLPSLAHTDRRDTEIIYFGSERDFQPDFGPAEALDDGRDYRAVVRADGQAVFIKNKYMPYRLSLGFETGQLKVKYEFQSGGKDDRPELYFPNFEAPFETPEESGYQVLIYHLPVEPLLFRNSPIFFDEDENEISDDGTVEIDDYSLMGGDFVDLTRLGGEKE